ncbi:MAG: hypothetical protein HN348_13710, partial [Proteobacteria bacterium]|nr:hypothetical protein [Pseudomonadota bacterium]
MRRSPMFNSLMELIRPPAQLWRELAGQLGLMYHKGADRMPGISGNFQGNEVTIHLNELGYRIEVAGAPPALRLAAEPFIGGQRDVIVGDSHFDREVHFQTKELYLVGRFNDHVRKLARSLVQKGVVVEGGVAKVRRLGRTMNAVTEAKGLVTEMTELVSSLGCDDDKVS